MNCIDPNALPAAIAMILLFLCAVAWALRGFVIIPICWLASMAIPYLLLRWGRS